MLPFKSHPRNLVDGLRIISKGWAYSKKDRRVFFYTLIPILISFGFLYLSFEFGYSHIKSLLFSFTIDKWTFAFWGGSLITWFLKVFIKTLAVALVVMLSYIFLQILYIPFYSLIAERVLDKEFGIRLENQSWSTFISYTLRMLKVSLLKSVLFLVIALLCFILSFVPPLGFLPFYFGALVIAYDAFDYSLEIFALDLGQRTHFMRKEFFLINGHALFLSFLSFIPGLMFLFLPFAVAGGALAVGEMYESKKQNS